MRLSQYFLPTLKENPAEAQIISHRYMLRAGMISQTTSGIYSWLPLGCRVLSKIEKIIEQGQDEIGCQRIIMPTVQPASLWQESGRYDDYGKEMLKFNDRHERPMLYGPTHEEVVTDIAKKYLHSYKQLPKILYQIHWKFRDEIRPRFGVMRGREFFMKDGYSFDIDAQGAYKTYELIYNSYLKIFKRMGLNVIPVKAASGAIGGNLSHEFHVVAETGESSIFYDKKFDDLRFEDYNMKTLEGIYCAADEMHSLEDCPIPKEDLISKRGIEVGHIFYFGTKYSKSMGLKITSQNGDSFYPEMGSYGIGVSRLVAATIESSHDDKGIIWSESVAPFRVCVINALNGDEKTTKISEDIYNNLEKQSVEVLYDDRHDSAGIKFSDMDLIGIPWQIIVGKKTLNSGNVELKCRKTGERHDLSVESVLGRFCR